MIIRNFKKLATNTQKNLALEILESGIRVAMPDIPLKKIIKENHLIFGSKKISLKNYDKIYLVAIGKAADLMAKTTVSLTKIDGGMVVIPQKTKSLIKSGNLVLLRSGHPIPNEKSIVAAKKTIAFLKK